MGDAEVEYLKDKNIPMLLETLAAELVVHKPGDPEAYLRERFAAGGESSESNERDPIAIYGTMLCPRTAIARMASVYSKATTTFKEIPDVKTIAHVAPFGRLPALEHSGLVVAEVGPVVKYLCQQSIVYPVTTRNRFKVESAFDTVVCNVLPEAVAAVDEKVFLPQKNNRPVDTAAVQASASRFRSALIQLQTGQFFVESEWVAGKTCSIADLALAACVFSLHTVAGFDCLSGLAKIEKWWAAIQRERCFTFGLKEFVEEARKLHR